MVVSGPHERRRRDFVGGSRGILPQREILTKSVCYKIRHLKANALIK